MDITIQERRFSFTSEYDISAPLASYYAKKAFFSFNDKIVLQNTRGTIQARIQGYFSPLRHKHDFNLVQEGRVYRFWCEKIWKQVYICKGNDVTFRLYEHKWLNYSIFQNERQIAAFTKNRLVIGRGNTYTIRMDSDADLILVVCLVLTINSSEESNDNNSGITFDFGNIGPEDRTFDDSWEPR
jgi:hypothetical protein